MKPNSFPWMIGTAGAGVLLGLGAALWLSAPKPNASSARPAQGKVDPPGSASAVAGNKLPVSGRGKPPRVEEPAPADADPRSRLANFDFVAAARALDARPEGEERTVAMRAVFREWAAVSPRDALAWISRMSPEQGRDEAREFVCYRVAEDDPKLAFDLARQAGAGTATLLVWDLAQQWAGEDATSARDWALALPAGADRDQILSRVCYELSQTDPAAAGAIVSREITAGPAQDEAAMSVLHQWAIRDFDAVSDWVANFPPGPLRTRAEAELTGIRDAANGPGTAR